MTTTISRVAPSLAATSLAHRSRGSWRRTKDSGVCHRHRQRRPFGLFGRIRCHASGLSRSTTRWTVYKVGGEGASPQGLPDRHKSARWPYDLPAYSWTGASGPSPIRVQETRARSPTARPRPIWEIPADSRCPAGKVNRGRGTPARVGESHRPFGLSVPRVEFLSGR